MKRLPTIYFSLALITALSVVGCGPSETPPADNAAASGSAESQDHDHAHDHSSEGPHHGSLIELGAEEYHAEMVHDEEAGTITIYIFDSSAKVAVPIEATEITINLKHDDKGEQFKLSAQPDEGDPEGKSSRFVSSEKELGDDLHDEHAEATLVLSIGGKSYRGKIAHDHEHDHAH